tara:strand:+ start:138 stop:422 length:285 start_codon:yes stop_codon:yes gene_type:complete
MGTIKNPENIFIAKIKILKRSSINDPEGNTIAEALNNLGFDDIDLVRIGKYIEITLESKNKKTAEGIVKKMCETLLVNLVIESYDVEIDPYIAK